MLACQTLRRVHQMARADRPALTIAGKDLAGPEGEDRPAGPRLDAGAINQGVVDAPDNANSLLQKRRQRD